jgi:O-antigen/teichoic acid export membrane protein
VNVAKDRLNSNRWLAAGLLRLRPLWGADTELGPRLVRGAVWSLLGGVACQLLALAASVWVARLLGREVFGEFGMIRWTAMMFSSFAGFGLGLTATRHVAEFRTSDPERTGRIVVLSSLLAVGTGTLMAAVVALSAGPLARHALDAPHLSGLLRVGSLVLLLNTVAGAQTGVLAGFEAFKTMSKVNVVVGLVSVPTLVAGTLAAGLPGAIWAVVCNLAVQVVLNHRAVCAETRCAGARLETRTCLREWNVLWSFSLPAALCSIVSAPALWIAQACLVNQAGGYAEIGVFNAASQWQMAILFVPQKVCLVALPVLSHLFAQGDWRQFQKALRLCAAVTAGTSVAVAGPIVACSWWIMRAYGSDFVSGAGTLCLLAAAAVLMSISLVGGQAIAAIGRVWSRFVVHVLWSLALVAATWALVAGGGGASRLAMAHVIAYGVHCLAQYGLLWLAWQRVRRTDRTEFSRLATEPQPQRLAA